MPAPHRGLRHLALYCDHLEDTVRFYTDLLGLKIVWQPDADNVYLSYNDDNLALHRAPTGFNTNGDQRLDHLGFFLDTKDDVNEWHDFLKNNGVIIKAAPKDHRDGTRSFYCADPEGNVVQMIYYQKV